jgi:hypothetical protein
MGFCFIKITFQDFWCYRLKQNLTKTKQKFTLQWDIGAYFLSLSKAISVIWFPNFMLLPYLLPYLYLIIWDINLTGFLLSF